MAQSIYGGRIDNEFDQRLLNTFLERIFTKGSFDSEFKLALKVDGHKDLKMPDGIRWVVDVIYSAKEAIVLMGYDRFVIFICCRREEFIHWVEMLPDTQTPSWLGLPSNAEKVLLTTQGTPQSVISVVWTRLLDQNTTLIFFRFFVIQGQSLTVSLYCSAFFLFQQGARSCIFCICFGQNTVCVCVEKNRRWLIFTI